jgi:hypothetical protein
MPALLIKAVERSEMRHGLVDGGLARGGVGDVASDGQRAGWQRGHEILQARCVEIHRGDVCSGCREPVAQRGTQPAGRAGDQDDLAGKVASGHQRSLWRALRYRSNTWAEVSFGV